MKWDDDPNGYLKHLCDDHNGYLKHLCMDTIISFCNEFCDKEVRKISISDLTKFIDKFMKDRTGFLQPEKLMKNEYYELDELLEIFTENERECIQQQNDFSLPKALKTIVNEVMNLKENIDIYNEKIEDAERRVSILEVEIKEIKAKQENARKEYEIFLESVQNSLCVIDKCVGDLETRLNRLENKN
jgi:hypothetical protein